MKKTRVAKCIYWLRKSDKNIEHDVIAGNVNETHGDLVNVHQYMHIHSYPP